jgi:hypothetical protein
VKDTTVEFRRANLPARITDKRINFAKFQRVEVDLRTPAGIESEKDTCSVGTTAFGVQWPISRIYIIITD